MKPYYQDDAVTLYHGDCEAVLPDLPVGWVLFRGPHGERVLWHFEGDLYNLSSALPNSGVGTVGDCTFDRDRLSPLRPTVTEADVERAAGAAMRTEPGTIWSLRWPAVLRAAFAAAGIEVSDR